eukprot:gene21390-28342_t
MEGNEDGEEEEGGGLEMEANVKRYKKCDGSKCGKLNCQGCKLEAIHLTVANSRDCPFCFRRMCSEACFSACPLKDVTPSSLEMGFAGGLSDEQLTSALELAGVFSMAPPPGPGPGGGAGGLPGLPGLPPSHTGDGGAGGGAEAPGHVAEASGAAIADEATPPGSVSQAGQPGSVHGSAQPGVHGGPEGGLGPPDPSLQAAVHAASSHHTAQTIRQLGPKSAPKLPASQSLHSMMMQALARLNNIDANQQMMLQRLSNAETTQQLLLQTLGLTLAMQNSPEAAAAAAQTAGQPAPTQPSPSSLPTGQVPSPSPPGSQPELRPDMSQPLIPGTCGMVPGPNANFNLDSAIAQYQQLLSAVMDPNSLPSQADLGAAGAVTFQAPQHGNHKAEAVSSIVDMLARGAPVAQQQFMGQQQGQAHQAGPPAAPSESHKE